MTFDGDVRGSPASTLDNTTILLLWHQLDTLIVSYIYLLASEARSQEKRRPGIKLDSVRIIYRAAGTCTEHQLVLMSRL